MVINVCSMAVIFTLRPQVTRPCLVVQRVEVKLLRCATIVTSSVGRKQRLGVLRNSQRRVQARELHCWVLWAIRDLFGKDKSALALDPSLSCRSSRTRAGKRGIFRDINVHLGLGTWLLKPNMAAIK